MNNEDVLSAFGEYIQSNRTALTTPPRALEILREFAFAIDPVPLDEATLQEIRVFESGHKVPATAMRPMPVSVVEIKRRVEKLKPELRYHELRFVMEVFRQFRREVLR